MQIRFSTVCNLLSDLELLYTREPPLLPTPLQTRTERLIEEWFKANRLVIDAPDTDLTALLSTFLPAKRTDRVYRLQPARLCSVLGRCFRLGWPRLADLERWKVPDCGTLAECVERVQNQAPNQVSKANAVTVDEVDATLARIAARYARPRGQTDAQEHESAAVVEKLLGRIYSRLSPRDCKWLTRLILKDFAPIALDEYLVISRTHRLLPLILRVRATLDGAVAALTELGLRKTQSFDSPEARERCIATLQKMAPVPGVFAGRPSYFFGRSVKYLVGAAEGRQMCLERKYDGEYCQVHVNLRSKGNEIQLFSKSGKDSTKDRQGLHYAIRRSLRIGRSDCSFNETAIVEGEMLVWSDEQQTILPFHKIRNHVWRTGRLIGTAKDDRPPPSEHLMIMFYDVLRVDNEALIHKSYNIRRRALLGLIDQVTGLGKVAPSQSIDFSAKGSTEQLLQCLSEAFARKWEGYMMKPVNEPYVSMGEHTSRKFYASFFKIKKDYITGFGDTADMLIVGASYDAAKAARLHIPNVPWTHFHLACRPVSHSASHSRQTYRVLHITNEGLEPDTLLKLCRDLKFRAVAGESTEARQICDISWPYDKSQQMLAGRVIFRDPVVVELKGFGFEIPGNETYYALRFPKFVKIKWGSEPDEAITFQELQDLAHKAMSVPKEETLLAEVAQYRKLLERSEFRSETNSLWWEDSDSRSVSPVRKGIPVYEDEEDSLAYDAPSMTTRSPFHVLQSLENLPEANANSLLLVRKVPNGAEDYATRIHRIAARKKRKRPETPSQHDTTSAGQETGSESQLSIPLPKYRRPQAHVPVYDTSKRLQEHEDMGNLTESSPNHETPLHPVFDKCSFVEGSPISPPKKVVMHPEASPATDGGLACSSLPKAVKSTPLSSIDSSPTFAVSEECRILVDSGVPEKYIERFRACYRSLHCVYNKMDIGAIATQQCILLLDPKDARSASWFYNVVSRSSFRKDACISVWDWRVMHWICAHKRGSASAAEDELTRRSRQNYIGRVDIRSGQATVTWANEIQSSQVKPMENPDGVMRAHLVTN